MGRVGSAAAAAAAASAEMQVHAAQLTRASARAILDCLAPSRMPEWLRSDRTEVDGQEISLHWSKTVALDARLEVEEREGRVHLTLVEGSLSNVELSVWVDEEPEAGQLREVRVEGLLAFPWPLPAALAQTLMRRQIPAWLSALVSVCDPDGSEGSAQSGD